MNRNVALKAAIFEAGLTQRELARRVGISESQISLALSGRFVLSEKEKDRISKELLKPVKELFAEK